MRKLIVAALGILLVVNAYAASAWPDACQSVGDHETLIDTLHQTENQTIAGATAHDIHTGLLQERQHPLSDLSDISTDMPCHSIGHVNQSVNQGVNESKEEQSISNASGLSKLANDHCEGSCICLHASFQPPVLSSSFYHAVRNTGNEIVSLQQHLTSITILPPRRPPKLPS